MNYYPLKNYTLAWTNNVLLALLKNILWKNLLNNSSSNLSLTPIFMILYLLLLTLWLLIKWNLISANIPNHKILAKERIILRIIQFIPNGI